MIPPSGSRGKVNGGPELDSKVSGGPGPRESDKGPGFWGFRRWAPWFLTAFALAVGIGVWEVFPVGIWHDDGVYVLLGKALAQGEGLRYVGVSGAPLAPKFPPLFPLLLSFVWRIFPSFPSNVSMLAGVNLVVTTAAAGIFYRYGDRGLGIPPPMALAVGALVWMSAHLWRVASIPLSEPLFLLTLLLALWAGVRMEKRTGSGPVVGFLLLGALTTYARTLGIAVLAAGVVVLFLEGRKRASLGVASGALALLLPWWIWIQRASETIPDPLKDTLGSYGGWLVSQARDQPQEFAVFVWKNVGSLLGRTSALVLPGLSGGWMILGLILVPILVLGLVDLYKRSGILALTLLFSYGILLVWPFRDVRLMVPFQPFLVLAVAMGFRKVLVPSPPSDRLRIPLIGVALAWAVLFGSTNGARLAGGWVGDSYRIRSSALRDAVETVSERTPLDAVVGAPELWSGIHLYSGRTVAPSARFRPISGDDPVEGTPAQQVQLWVQAGITHLLLEHGGLVNGEALNRVDEVCPAGTVVILDSGDGQLLVSLNWDRECQERALAPPALPGGGAMEPGMDE